jgi:hypothetical protein
MANFFKRLNKRTNNKYKGKLPLICFNCDGISHFVKKIPHKKNKENDEDYSNRKQTYKGKGTTKKFFKKRLCTKKGISSSDEDEFSDSEIERVIFMAVEDNGSGVLCPSCGACHLLIWLSAPHVFTLQESIHHLFSYPYIF